VAERPEAAVEVESRRTVLVPREPEAVFALGAAPPPEGRTGAGGSEVAAIAGSSAAKPHWSQ
jgi:hypothetical protein